MCPRDAEVVEGIRLLASTEGIFAETAGGVVVATYRKLLRDATGRILAEADGIVVAPRVSGSIAAPGSFLRVARR